MTAKKKNQIKNVVIGILVAVVGVWGFLAFRYMQKQKAQRVADEAANGEGESTGTGTGTGNGTGDSSTQPAQMNFYKGNLNGYR